MKFKMTHLFMKEISSEFSEDNPPSWLLHKQFKWWWEEHVLKLNVNDSIKSDFQQITRIA